MKWKHLLTSFALFISVFSSICLVSNTDRAVAADTLHLQFVTHAAFFSNEMKVTPALDPQVFLKENNAPEQIGPQQIKHVAGFRNLHVDDQPATELFSSIGKKLRLTAGNWLGAKGDATITPEGGGADIVATFSGLKPHGVYSLFENHFDTKPIGFTPLDGAGKTNSFVANKKGEATIQVHSPEMLTHANAILLVYHSDSKPHGSDRGTIGVNAFHHLIARLP